MSELQADPTTAAYVRAQADLAGVSVAQWLSRHFRDAALRESAVAHVAWYAERPGLLEEEAAAAETANTEADVA